MASGGKPPPTLGLYCVSQRVLSSRPRSTRLGIAIAAANPSNDTDTGVITVGIAMLVGPLFRQQ